MRQRELDFLRGMAVLLVIFNHAHIYTFLMNAGWAGVDLFFVLSGFLVSGLLFREHQQFDNVKAVRFLVRRGFKIYPLFYSTIGLAILFQYLYHDSWPPYYQIVSELFFLQSYIKGLLTVTWSLAVEEHFYFILMGFVSLLGTFRLFDRQRLLFLLLLAVMLLCLGLRVYTFIHFPFRDQTHVFPTHLRIDSILFGVAIAYMYHFKGEQLLIFSRNRGWFYLISFLLISVAFLFDRQSFLVYTLGYSLLYLGFGLLLLLFVLDPAINTKLDRIFMPWIAGAIARVGFYSYGIYLWHMMVILYVLPLFHKTELFNYGTVPEFLLYVTLSIVSGMFLSATVEQYFLKVRDIYFPRR